jgi:shikimate kinase
MARDRSDRIFLLGMMGAGKTTVGRALAERLGRPFLDNDELVRAVTGREPAEIAATDGEEALHDAEAAAVRAGAERPGPAIVAVAGSVVERAAERALLRRTGFVVWLRATPATLRARIGSGAGRRADATDLDWLVARAVERAPVYAAAADLVVDVDDRPVDAIVSAIVDALPDPSAG